MKNYKFLIISALTGLIVGIFSSQTFLAHSWLALIVWSLVGLIYGYLLKNKRQAYTSGALYGVFLTVSYVLLGFQGSSDKFAGFLVLTFVIGIIGALFGSAIFTLGFLLKHKLNIKSSK